jgi:2-polyprenyl-3-methyl-5-hydroxy-6-metoxy-1,4-benzoquinol methylase
MKDTFNVWSTVDELNIDDTMDLILTGKKANEAKPDTWLYDYIGNQSDTLKVLDFGCGVGRNTFGMGMHSPTWEVMGYDNDSMLSKRAEFHKIHYKNKQGNSNVEFMSDWDACKDIKFDAIFCCIVLQHIHEDALIQYISDFKNMTSKVIVFGRRFNDDVKNRSIWQILEENGLLPDSFYVDGRKISFATEGDPHQHNLAIYNI